jgi:PAS domain S-box-containing protein
MFLFDKTEYKIPLIFLIVSTIWIIFSDILLFDYINIPELKEYISIFKGLLYISVAAMIIYFLLKMDFKKIRATENELKITEEYYYKAFQKNITPSLLIDKNSFEIIDANESALKLFKYNLSEFKKMKLTEFIFIDNSSIFNYTINFKLNLDSLIQTTCVLASGKKIEIELMTAPVYLKNEILLQCSIHDISEKQNILISLKESEHRYKKLVENIPDVIYVFSLRNGLSYISPQFVNLFGKNNYVLSEGDDLILNTINSEDKSNYLSFRKRIFNNFEPDELIYQITDFNGNTKWIYDRVFSITPSNDDILFEGVLTDITEKRKLLDDLVAANRSINDSLKLKNVILSNLNHELRTPLNGIIGFSRLIQKINNNSEISEYLDLVLESSYRLNNTLNSILSLNEIEAGHRELFYEESGIKEFLKIIFDSYESVALKKGIKLNYEVIADAKFECDINILSQVVNNIVENSLKFTNVGSVSLIGDISTIEKGEPKFKLSVVDTGKGINPDKIKQIFEEFRQESEGIVRTFEGIGLGLTISKKLIDLLDGKISVNSTLNVGSEFIVEIPLKKQKKTD